MEQSHAVSRLALFDCLPCALRRVWKESGISLASIKRVRDGKPLRPDKLSKLLQTLSAIYGRTFSLQNVVGVNGMISNVSTTLPTIAEASHSAEKREKHNHTITATVLLTEEREKHTYTVQELFDNLPITLIELADRAGLSEFTVAHIRDGKTSRRTSINRLLRVLSEVYGRQLSLRNVTGINVQVNQRLEKKEANYDSTAHQLNHLDH